jgi:3-hydroxymyristoyl/3-hydroxydecanoyl-(acyl carrier protein) dehydratase
MPGSLGVESILQAMQIFALHQDAGRPFQSPRFVQRLNHRVQWKYRGQLIPADDQMALDVHIKGVERAEGAVMISGEASLWKNKIRIYEITDAAFCLEESSPNEGGQE